MVKFILLCLLSLIPLYGEDKPKEFLEGFEASAFSSDDETIDLNHVIIQTPSPITAKVDVVTGTYLENSEDLQESSAEPLRVRRFFCSGSPSDKFYGGWFFNPESYLVANFEYKNNLFAACGEEEGAINRYKDLSSGRYGYTIDCHNDYVHSSLNGQRDPLNTRINYQKEFFPKKNKRKEIFRWRGEILSGDGTRRYFDSDYWHWHTPSYSYQAGFFKEKKKVEAYPHIWMPYQLRISEERRPNGNVVKYFYNEKEPIFHHSCFIDGPKFQTLSAIEVWNRTKSKILGRVNFNYRGYSSCYRGEEISHLDITSSNNRKSSFEYQNQKITKASSQGKVTEEYEYDEDNLCKVIRPEGRIFSTEYYPDHRVKAQYASLGANGELLAIARFIYRSSETEAIDAQGNKKIYRIDGDKRITSMETYEGNILFRVDRMMWDRNNGDLLQKSIEDGKGRFLIKKEYRYDKNHNVIQEKISDEKGSDTTFYTYSDDGFNLLLSETNGNKKVCFEYEPDTNLLQKELVYENEKIKKRIFHFYNDMGSCEKTIIDDGSGMRHEELTDVTCRKIVISKVKQDGSGIGLPEVIEERALDKSGQEVLLSKVVNAYTSFGKIFREDHYDATNTLRYCLKRDYDSNERLISETDALGFTTRLSYDANNNIIKIEGPRSDQCREIIYDKANRPIKISERLLDGTCLTTERQYDSLNHVIKTIDPSGFQASYSYNVLGQMTSVVNPDGSIVRKEYDALGNEIKSIDGNGYETTKIYDHHGKPVYIYYPDKTEEIFAYNSLGQLIYKKDRGGAQITVSYDIFDHPINSCINDKNGKELKRLSQKASSFFILSETDAEGVSTTYGYDFAGRKTVEEKAGKKTFFSYDPLGRLSVTQVGDTFYRDVYDLKNRIIEKRVEDAFGATIRLQGYEYDACDNQTAIINSKGRSETLYDSLGKIIEKKDPAGNKTLFSYSYKGGIVSSEKSPNGIEKVISLDSMGHIKTTKRLNAKGEIIEESSFSYDKNGNLNEQTFTHFDGTKKLDTLCSQIGYGPMNRKEKIIESGEKETSYIYDENGRLQATVNPDKTLLEYLYDDLGRMIQFSGKEFDYHYSYNKNDQVISVEDKITNTTTTRSYDSLGNIVMEKLSNDLTLEYGYDSLSRRILLRLPDQSEVHYTYLYDQLYSIERKGFKTDYCERDREGFLTKVCLPFGEITYERDSLSRLRAIHAPFFEEKGFSYDTVGNLEEYLINDSLGEERCKFTYDDLNQLATENQRSYHFDSLANCLKKDSTIYTLNALCQIISNAILYDKNGNLLADSSCVYGYDALSRLTDVKKGDEHLIFSYDSFNRRQSKKVYRNDTLLFEELYLWDGQNEIGSITSNKISTLRILGEGFRAEIGAAVLLELDGKTYLPIHDHRGCLASLIDIDSKIPIETHRYSAFGENSSSSLSPWTFVSKRKDDETGLYYFGRRYFCPHLARWTTPDPKGFTDGPNLYAYVHNAPLTAFDLYGLRTEEGRATNFCELAYDAFHWFYSEISELNERISSQSAIETNERFCPHFYPNLEAKCHEKSELLCYPGSMQTPHVYVTFDNGMDTDRNTLDEDIEYLKRIISDITIEAAFCPTQGYLKDLCVCSMCLNRHMVTPGVSVVMEAWEKILKHDPEGIIFNFSHSNGTIRTRNALEHSLSEVTSHVISIAVAPGAYIEKGLCLESVHLRSTRDFVPLLDSRGKRRCEESTTVIKPAPGAPFFDHDFKSPTYREEIHRQFWEMVVDYIK